MAVVDVLLRAERLFSSVSVYLNTIVIALVIVLVGFILGKIVESILRQLLARMDVDERLGRLFNAKRNYARAIRRTIVRTIYVVTVIIALDKLSLVRPVFVMVTFLAIIVILISFILTGIEVVPNITARAALRRKNITVGDEIIYSDKTGTIQGRIIDVTMTDVHLKRRNGDILFIPNAVFLRESVTKKRRMI